MLWAAALSCFFGFFHAGEITVPSATAFDPAAYLAWGDVSSDNDHHPSVIRFFLKHSKTDQFGQGAAVYVGTTGSDLCQVAAILHYVVIRGDGQGPFFHFVDGSPLTKARFVARVRDALTRAGYTCQNYTGHSFCIGVATTAAAAGIPDSTIQALGQWSSAAFIRYICTPRDRLAQLSASLAPPTSRPRR